MSDATPLADLPAEWEHMAEALSRTLAARLGTADDEIATLRICAQQVRAALVSHTDLRAAVEALADEWEVRAGRGIGTLSDAVVDIRALLAPAPASETARCVCDGAMWFSDEENAIRHPFLISADCAIHSPTPINVPDPTPPPTVQADRDAGYDCPHGHPLPENCGLCTGCDS